MFMCALESCFMSVCVLVFVFVHEWVKRTKGTVEQDGDLAGGGGREERGEGGREGGDGGYHSMRHAALLSCVHPAVRIMFGTLAQAPRHPRPAERRRKKKYWPILTQRQVERSRSKKIKDFIVFEWVKKSRLHSFANCREKGRGSLCVFSVCKEADMRQIKTKI